jgi:large subunit ribosomal protein L3
MTQTFLPDGQVVPVTVIEAGPCTVVGKRVPGKHGYCAVQVGFSKVKPSKINKPLKGQFDKAKVEPHRIIREFKTESPDEYEVGQEIKVGVFKTSDKVKVTGTSKGRGFQGVIKRWGFHGGKATHGSMFHRAPGSVGAGTYPGKLWKGTKLPGRMGNKRITTRGLEIVRVDEEKNFLFIKGAVPGHNGGTVLIQKL